MIRVRTFNIFLFGSSENGVVGPNILWYYGGNPFTFAT